MPENDLEILRSKRLNLSRSLTSIIKFNFKIINNYLQKVDIDQLSDSKYLQNLFSIVSQYSEENKESTITRLPRYFTFCLDFNKNSAWESIYTEEERKSIYK